MGNSIIVFEKTALREMIFRGSILTFQNPNSKSAPHTLQGLVDSTFTKILTHLGYEVLTV